MAKAIWKEKVIAESDNYKITEGNIYFPPESVKKEFLKDSNHHTTCPFKGIASYYDILIDGEVNKDAAWYYPKPKPGFEKIKNHIAFWKGVNVKE
jgi:uncharacterized protein (DUF427 family)